MMTWLKIMAGDLDELPGSLFLSVELLGISLLIILYPSS